MEKYINIVFFDFYQMRIYGVFKRLLDFSFALIILVIISPILVFIAFGVLLSTGRPITFKSNRIGINKTIFTVYKFRTLRNGSVRESNGLCAIKSATTKLTRFLRNTHLDETLQLYNVLRGDMSFIGPRPLDVERYNYLVKNNADWKGIFGVKPGISCLNQLARYSKIQSKRILKYAGMNERNRVMLDILYNTKYSLFLDFRIAIWTVLYLFERFVLETYSHIRQFVLGRVVQVEELFGVKRSPAEEVDEVLG